MGQVFRPSCRCTTPGASFSRNQTFAETFSSAAPNHHRAIWVRQELVYVCWGVPERRLSIAGTSHVWSSRCSILQAPLERLGLSLCASRFLSSGSPHLARCMPLLMVRVYSTNKHTYNLDRQSTKENRQTFRQTRQTLVAFRVSLVRAAIFPIAFLSLGSSILKSSVATNTRGLSSCAFCGAVVADWGTAGDVGAGRGDVGAGRNAESVPWPWGLDFATAFLDMIFENNWNLVTQFLENFCPRRTGRFVPNMEILRDGRSRVSNPRAIYQGPCLDLEAHRLVLSAGVWMTSGNTVSLDTATIPSRSDAVPSDAIASFRRST